MKSITEQRWFYAVALVCSSACTTGFFFLIARNLPIGWIFGAPFAVTTVVLAWTTTRSDDWHAKRLDKEASRSHKLDDWLARNPTIRLLSTLVGLIAFAAAAIKVARWVIERR